MPDAMSCPEYLRLRTDYEAALRQWGDVLLAQHAGLLVGDVERALEIRKDAADERDAANKRMEDHKWSCPVCREAFRQFQNPNKKKLNRRNLEVRSTETRLRPEKTLSAVGFFGIDRAVADRLALHGRSAGPLPDGRERTTDLVLGEQKLRFFFEEIRDLRTRCGQQDDLTTDPEYFIAANTSRFRRVAAVLIRRDQELEACVFFMEHCILGVALGLLHGGDNNGESLVVGPEAFRVEYVHLAAQFLLGFWRIHGVFLRMSGSFRHCTDVMGPESRHCIFVARDTSSKLPLESTYRKMLAGMGPRTRRSLAGKRRQLEERAQVIFLPVLEPADALEAMLQLRPRAMPRRFAKFYRVRYRMLCQRPEFFCMGMCLPDGTWLSILSGWRRDRVTHVDLQMNDSRFKKESLSAVMRAFMLEHEIACKQQMIDFVGGTSLLLKRYCRPIEPCTDIFLWRPCLRALLSKMVFPLLKEDSIYERIKKPTA